MGRKDEAAADLAKAKEAVLPVGPQQVAVRYDTTLDILDKSMGALGVDLRSLFSRAQVQRSDPEVKQGFLEAQSLAVAWASFLANSPAPAIHRNSHDRRLLALNLLIQCLNDLGQYLTTNDEGTFSDARINLGEALKQFSAAQTSYRSEVGGTGKGNAS
jgi:hypothetical protein